MANSVSQVASAYCNLSLTPAQQARLARLTPYRFNTWTLPDGALLTEPYLPLACPPAVPFTVIHTPPRPSDVPDYVETLNNPAVALQLYSPPYPYCPSHAEERGKTVGQAVEAYFTKLIAKLDELGEEKEKELQELPLGEGWRPDGLLCSAMRRQDTGEWLGDLFTQRWMFEDIREEGERARVLAEMGKKAPGDPGVPWTFGFYLHPRAHGKRLMSPSLASVISYFRTLLNSEELYGAAWVDNVPSLRIQEKNGFVKFASWVKQVSEAKGGGIRETDALKWQKPAE